MSSLKSGFERVPAALRWEDRARCMDSMRLGMWIPEVQCIPLDARLRQNGECMALTFSSWHEEISNETMTQKGRVQSQGSEDCPRLKQAEQRTSYRISLDDVCPSIPCGRAMALVVDKISILLHQFIGIEGFAVLKCKYA